jgi:hypothetical protein
MAGRWRSTNNPFQPNPSCGGPIYFDHLRVTRASLPAGYGVELFAPHPYSAVEAENVMGIRPMSGSDVHWTPSSGQFSFRFAVYNPATVPQSVTQQVLRFHDRGLAESGPLAFSRQHVYGERLDTLLDLQAWKTDAAGAEVPWRDPLHPTKDTWLALDDIGDQAAATLRAAWASGSSSPAGSAESRKGWHAGLRRPHGRSRGRIGHSRRRRSDARRWGV